MKNVKCTNCTHMMWLTNPDDGSRYMWCPVHDDSYDETEPRDCESYEPATNFDIILRMNAEDLAKRLRNGSYCPDKDTDCMEVPCRECILQWLQEVAT